MNSVEHEDLTKAPSSADSRAGRITKRILGLYLGSVGDRFADAVTLFSGTLLFLVLHIVLWWWWLSSDAIETAPYALLTMVLSLEAIVLSTLVLMSQNRQAERDHAWAERDRERHKRIEKIAEHIDVLEAQQFKILFHLERLLGDEAKEDEIPKDITTPSI